MARSDVSIIIPVYNGLGHLQRLFATLFANTQDEGVRFVIVDDCSPDRAVQDFLAAEAKKDGRATLVRNEANLGFVQSVNRGLAMSAGRHCVLLNSDTEVPAGWLERLMRPIEEDPTIASVTPFTNGGWFTAIPIAGSDNREWVEKFSVSEIDDFVRTLSLPAEFAENPCGTGFCMAMNAQALAAVGGLDEAFGRGYGEEADWCCRAAAAGYRHVVARDLFVAHFHGGSFDVAEGLRLRAAHVKMLVERHPSYVTNKKAFYAGNGRKWQEYVARPVREHFAAIWDDGRPARRVLLVSNELARTEAPMSLLRYAGYFLEAGYLVDIVSLRGGAMERDFQRAGCMVEVCGCEEDEILAASERIRGRKYDLVVCNTVVTWRFVRELRKRFHVEWMIREAWIVEGYLRREPAIAELIREHEGVWTVSRLASEYLAKTRAGLPYVEDAVEDRFVEFARGEGHCRFGCIGALNANKNVEGLVRAFLRAQRESPEMTLDICGAEQGGAELTARLRHLVGDNASVRLLGEVAGEEKQRFFERIDVLCVPSYSGSSSLALLEGAMYGKALIATETTGAKYVAEGGAGIVVPPGDELALAEALRQMGEELEAGRLAARCHQAREYYLKHAMPERERAAILALACGTARQGEEPFPFEHDEIEPLAEDAIPLVFTIDADFALPLRIFLESLVRTNPGEKFDILVAINGADEEATAACRRWLMSMEGLSIRYIDMKDELDAAGLWTKEPVAPYSHVCWRRLLLPRILAKYRKYIYLDADMVCRGKIRELYETELGDHYLAAVYDPGAWRRAKKNVPHRRWMEDHGFDAWWRYFNSGVQVVNAEKMREGDFIERSIALAIDNDFAPDQDALNILCGENVVLLSPRWNFQVGVYRVDDGIVRPKNPVLVHFTGAKPWLDPELVPMYSEEWWGAVPEGVKETLRGELVAAKRAERAAWRRAEQELARLEKPRNLLRRLVKVLLPAGVVRWVRARRKGRK